MLVYKDGSSARSDLRFVITPDAGKIGSRQGACLLVNVQAITGEGLAAGSRHGTEQINEGLEKSENHEEHFQ